MLELGVPQLIWLLTAVCSTAYSVAHDGQQKKASKHNGAASVIGCALGLGLLYWGGFFG